MRGMMLSHFFELELGSDMSIEISPDRSGFQQLQNKLRRNSEVLVDLPAVELRL
jgi:hypothetical protein